VSCKRENLSTGVLSRRVFCKTLGGVAGVMFFAGFAGCASQSPFGRAALVAANIPENLEVGETIPGFGGYAWLVLDINDERATIITKDVVAIKLYNDPDSFSGTHEDLYNADWEHCTLRAWLNDDFYHTTFNDAEKAVIAESHITNPDNPVYGTPGCGVTTDRVYILSIDEAERYFAGNGARIATMDNVAAKEFIEETFVDVGDAANLTDDEIQRILSSFPWLLRTPGEDIWRTSAVDADGSLLAEFRDKPEAPGGIRPVLQINLSA
jgi:hypothetical protein